MSVGIVEGANDKFDTDQVNSFSCLDRLDGTRHMINPIATSAYNTWQIRVKQTLQAIIYKTGCYYQYHISLQTI